MKDEQSYANTWAPVATPAIEWYGHSSLLDHAFSCLFDEMVGHVDPLWSVKPADTDRRHYTISE